MGCLGPIYILIVMVTGVPAIFKLGWALGWCGTLSPWLALSGGGAIAEAARGTVGKGAWITVLLGIALIGISLWWPSYVGWHLLIFGYDIPGWVENLIGAFVGFGFGSSRRLNPPVASPQ